MAKGIFLPYHSFDKIMLNFLISGAREVEACPSKIFQLSLHITKFSEFTGERCKMEEQNGDQEKGGVSFVPKDV